MFNLLGNKKSQTLKKKSQKIFDVFTNTQIQVEKVNSQIMVLTEGKRAEAKKILEEIQQMDEIASKNDILSKRVHKFINSEPENQIV